MSIVELFVICGCVLGIITLIVIAIYQRSHYKHTIVEQNDRIDSLFHDTEAYKQVIRYQDEQLRNIKQDSLRKTIQIATYAENYYGAMARLQHHNDLATEKNKDYLAISNKWTNVKERLEALLR